MGSYQIPVSALVVALLAAILWRPFILISTAVVNGKFASLHEMFPYFVGMSIFIVGALYFRLNNRFFVWLGTISYSLYLLHYILVYSVWVLIRSRFSEWGNLHLSVYLLICVFLSIVLSGLVYHCIEKPAIKLGRRLQYR